MADDDEMSGLMRRQQTVDMTVRQMERWLIEAKAVANKHLKVPSDDLIVQLAVGMANAHELADIGSVLDWNLSEVQNAIAMK